jgi:hypothetical protein
MRTTTYLLAPLALGLMLLPHPSSASPLTPGLMGAGPVATDAGLLENVRYNHGHHRYFYGHHRHYGYSPYYYGYSPNYCDGYYGGCGYPYGYGYGYGAPFLGFGFGFGGGHHHHH